MLKKKPPAANEPAASTSGASSAVERPRTDDRGVDDTDPMTDNQVINFAALRFADDYAEYLARADSGGSTYGLLKRHAFAQSSLRVRPTGYLPTAAGADDGGNDATMAAGPTLKCSRQRRSKSLVPPPRTTSGWDAGGGPPDGAAYALPDQKSIIKALCEQTQRQQKKVSTPQVCRC